MPRGAVSKRSSATVAGPAGGGGLPSLAFLTKLEMSLYDASLLVKGTLATVLSLECPWNYDPTSTLVPDVDAGNPIGRTIVAAAGALGGNWLRDRQFCAERWKEQPLWWIDPASSGGPASDENPGTALLPLYSVNELEDRIGGPALASTFHDVTIASSVLVPVVTRDYQRDGGHYLFFHGPLTPISFGAAPSGVVAAGACTVAWNDATQTVGTIGCAGIPVSWTASSMIDKLAIIVGGPRAGTYFWLLEDLGLVGGVPTARISPPALVAFGGLPSTVLAGDEIQVYDTVQLGTTLSSDTLGGPGAQTDFQYLILGAATSHSFEVKEGYALIDACLINGADTAADALLQLTGCQVARGCRAEAGAAIAAWDCYAPNDGAGGGGWEAREQSTIGLSRCVSYGTIQVRPGGQVLGFEETWIATLAVGPLVAWHVLPGGLVDVYSQPTRVWGDNVSTAILIDAQGRWVFDHAKPPVFAGAATDVVLGVMAPLTFAQLPYTSPIDQASMVEGNASNGTEDQFVAQAADVNPVGAAVAVLTLAFAVNGLRDVIVHSVWCCQQAAATTGTVELWIDGVAVQSFAQGGIAGMGGFYDAGANLWMAQLAAGAHTASVAAGTAAGQFFFRAATQPGLEGSSILVRELYG